MTARKAVDPIIASLLLIAIAVAAGIIVYVYVNSLAGGLTQGGGQQVSDQLAMDAYNFQTLTAPVITVRDVGSTTVTINQVFIDGAPASVTSSSPSSCGTGGSTISPTSTCQIILGTTGITSGTAHTIKIVTTSGGTSVMTIIAGRTG